MKYTIFSQNDKYLWITYRGWDFRVCREDINKNELFEKLNKKVDLFNKRMSAMF